MLNSGDLEYIDAEGRICIAGRAKDLIIRSGHDIDPLMIDNAMAAHPSVRDPAGDGPAVGPVVEQALSAYLFEAQVSIG